MQSCRSTDRDALFRAKKARSAARALQFPNNCPLLSHVAGRERIISPLINKELISVKLPLTLLQRLGENAAGSGLGGTGGSALCPGECGALYKWNKPGLNPKQDSISNFFMLLLLVPEKKCPLQSNLIDFERTRTVTNLSGFVDLLRFSAEMCFFVFVCF